MKPIFTLAAAFLLFATHAHAATRAQVEADLLSAATRGSENMSVALDAFKADNPDKGCLYLTYARNNMEEALGLIAQDRPLVQAEPASDQKTADLAELDTMEGQFTDMRDRMNIQLEKRCD